MWVCVWVGAQYGYIGKDWIYCDEGDCTWEEGVRRCVRVCLGMCILLAEGQGFDKDGDKGK